MNTFPNADRRTALSRFGHALSDPIRAHILLELRRGSAYPSDLADLLSVSRQSMSNHLACLRGCGLVIREPVGRRSRYALADQRIGAALDELLQMTLVTEERCCEGPTCTC